jgi:hypothetical protein
MENARKQENTSSTPGIPGVEGPKIV